jgi:hypothetical protein
VVDLKLVAFHYTLQSLAGVSKWVHHLPPWLRLISLCCFEKTLVVKKCAGEIEAHLIDNQLVHLGMDCVAKKTALQHW